MSKKILIADDEKEEIDYLSSILKRANYEVISTTKGKEVFDLAKEFKPDVIILDMIMPDMKGGEIYSVISNDPLLCDIPVIFLTGMITKDEEKRIKKERGNYSLLAKPTSREEILEAIEKVLESK
ncbi:MAG: response regulator [Candidatus Omnitrophica bacterium]|nr:response regulator [Candidatus Omnitrophota bacterium]